MERGFKVKRVGIAIISAVFLMTGVSPVIAAAPQASLSSHSVSVGTTGTASMVSNQNGSAGFSPDTTVSGNCGSSSITGYSSGGEMYASWNVKSNGACGGAIIALELYVNFYEGSSCSGTKLDTIDIIKSVPANTFQSGTTDDTPVEAPEGGVNYCTDLQGNVVFSNLNSAAVETPTSVFYVPA